MITLGVIFLLGMLLGAEIPYWLFGLLIICDTILIALGKEHL